MLITADQFRDIYGKIAGGLEDDALEAMIASADGLMAGYCGYPENDDGIRTLVSSTYTLYVSAPSRIPGVLCLCVAPIVSVTSVHVDEARAYGPSTALVEGTDFDVDLVLGRLAILPSSAAEWPSAYRATRVVLEAGYATTPPALLPVVESVVQALLDRPNLQQQASASIGGASISPTDLDNFLPAAVRAALDAGFKLGCR